MNPPRSFLANNPGPFTLEGTRSFVVGHTRPALIDPGPEDADHIRALLDALNDAEEVTILLTHGHGDHVDAVDSILEEVRRKGGLWARVLGAGHPAAHPVAPTDVIRTDHGDLYAVPTPGHTRDHLAFHWPDARALFAGDMVLGEGDTTWVAEYPGCVADYLASLTRLEAMDLAVVFPTHGPDIHDVTDLWGRYRRHRETRIAAVREALGENPVAGAGEVLDAVYGDTIPDGLAGAALASLKALMEYVMDHPDGTP